MTISRRGFLGAILAAAVAPAVVKATNLMKVVPISDTGIVGLDNSLKIPDQLLVPGSESLFGNSDFTIEMWSKRDASAWHHVAQTKSNGVVRNYLDGELVSSETLSPYIGLITLSENGQFSVGGSLHTPGQYVDDIRFTKDVVRDIPVQPKHKANPPRNPFALNQPFSVFRINK